MSEINNALGLAGSGVKHTTSDGRVWTFFPLPKSAQADFESWMEDRAWAAVVRASKHLSGEAYDRLVDRTQEKIDAGEYAITGDKFQKAIQTPAGLMLFLRLLLKEKHPDTADQDLGFIMNDNPAELQLVLKRLYPKNVQAPAVEPSQAGD